MYIDQPQQLPPPPQSISPLHQRVHQRFKAVFGPPDTSMGRDDHWALYPTPRSVSINVLVDGLPHLPTVWVFDPHDRTDSVVSTVVTTEAHLEEIIAEIHLRVLRAKEKGMLGGEIGAE